MNKSMIVAKTDFKNALKLKMVKYGLIMASAFGPIMSFIVMLGVLPLVPPGEADMLLGFMSPLITAMLGMFAIIPTTMIAANALVGEREMNTLEPLLCTPLTDRELLWGKTLAGALPSLIILLASTAVTTIGIAIGSVAMGHPMIIFPDLAGFFLLATATPLMIFAVVAVMIIISGRVTRVYEAYQATTGIILVFMIPMMLPIVGIETGGIAELVWLSNFVTLIIAALIFIVGWAIAFRLFNRDKLVSMV
ncbi:MAG: ABC transporter permease subunit [Candidatus Thorarchaeota archaeon]|jgi:ABC-type Na+ efflux pump permease subunit